MKNTLTKGIGSSYTIIVELNAQDHDTLHQKTLQSLQGEVKVPGFRQGHVPLHMVEKQIKPEYLQMAFMEEIINASIKSLIKEHTTIQFIGQPYDLHEEVKGENKVITYKLDTYPDVIIENDGWKKLTIPAMDTAISKDEIQMAITNLQKQYADYTDAEDITQSTLVKASYRMLDKEGSELHKGSAFFGEEEYTESSLLWKTVEGKKKGDLIEIPYDEKKLPHAVHYHPHGDETAKKIKTLSMTIIDTKNSILPDLNDSATLTKLFQSPDITTYDALVEKVKSVLIEQKEEKGLQESIEKMLIDARASLKVEIPNTFLKEEMGARIKQLGDRMGGEEGLKQYFTKIGEQKTNEMYDEIKASAKESLEKFFILRKLVELLDLNDINWDNALDAERKIYAKLSSGISLAEKALAKKTTTKKQTTDTENEEKIPTKKTTKKAKAE